MPVLEYFVDHKNDYVDVYRGVIPREVYRHEEKYREFRAWRPVN